MQNSLDDTINEILAIDLEIQNLKSKRGKLAGEVNLAIAPQVQEQLATKDYGCGTANVEIGSYKIKAVVGKEVTWEQSKLAALYERIKASNENPLDYLKIEYDVPESKFKAWPEVIQKAFVDARTVEPSAAKVTYERKE